MLFVSIILALVIAACHSGPWVPASYGQDGGENTGPDQSPPDGSENAPDTETDYAPAAGCTFHSRGDVQTSQLWIGNPTWSFTANDTAVRFHMPSKMFAMFLGYVQELFDINPNFLAAIAGKETMATFEDTGGRWLYALQNSATSDGPFQFERTTAMAEMANAFPSRIESTSSPYHQAYVNNFDTSAIPIALYMVWEEEYLSNCARFGFDEFIEGAQDPDVLFQTAAFAYNRGLWNQALDDMLVTNRSRCIASDDVVADCGINGTFDYNVDIGSICANLATADQVYDEAIGRSDIADFIDQLSFTYPAGSIDWQEVEANALLAFDEFRGTAQALSVRYHWLPVINKILPMLPGAEFPGGPFSDYMSSSRCSP